MKITLDLNEYELKTLKMALRNQLSSLTEEYIKEDSDWRKRQIDSEAVDRVCHANYKKQVAIDNILEMIEDAEDEN